MGEDLRILFIEAYKNWLEAKTFSDREHTWCEYTQIRDLWCGKGKAFEVWSNRGPEGYTHSETNEEYN